MTTPGYAGPQLILVILSPAHTRTVSVFPRQSRDEDPSKVPPSDLPHTRPGRPAGQCPVRRLRLLPSDSELFEARDEIFRRRPKVPR